MAIDFFFNPDMGIWIIPWSCLSERYSPQAGQTDLDVPVAAGVDFAFFSGLDSFEILGEESDQDVDLLLSLPLLFYVLTSLVSLSRFLILMLRFP